VYNCSNGALMKTVHKVYGSTCVSLHYYDESKRFIAGFARGQVCIFDENVLEECILIRQFECYPDTIPTELDPKDPGRVSGTKLAAAQPVTNLFGHSTASAGGGRGAVDSSKLAKEMLGIEFDHSTHTVITAGSTDGIMRFWDYDSSKCAAEITVCDVKTCQIVFIKLLQPYPLVVTSDSSGNIILWGSRGTNWMGVKLTGFLNMTPASAETEPKARHADETDTAPRRALPPNRSRTPAIVQRAEELAQSAANSDFEDDESVTFRNIKAPSRKSERELKIDSDAMREATLLKAEREYLDSEAKWGRCSAAHALGWNAASMQLITGDDLGNIRCFSLREALVDLQKEQLLQEHGDHHHHHEALGLCRDLPRDESSALAPIDHDVTTYVLASPDNAMSYLGVKFRWSLYAHTDRIVHCTCTPEGVLTSAADRLVKMWTYDGLPIGTLLQSVPIGTRSKTWDLVLDVKSLIAKENEELDGIIEQVTALSLQEGKPDIYSMDFTGMQLGAESANFSQSVLRQRIERTTKILGLDFPSSSNNANKSSHGGGDDLGSIDGGASFTGSFAGSVGSSAGGKSLADALNEIKSTESGVDYELKTKSMSYIQQRRKANKLENMARTYEEKSGVRLNTAPSKEISIWEGEDKDNNKEVDFDKLLSSAAPNKDDSSVNDDLYSVSIIAERQAAERAKHSAAVGAVKSKLAKSIQMAHERGARTIYMKNSCKKYKTFDALDTAIQTNGASAKDNAITEEEASNLKAQRERKLRGATSIGSPFLMSARERKNSLLATAALKAAAAAAAATAGSSSPTQGTGTGSGAGAGAGAAGVGGGGGAGGGGGLLASSSASTRGGVPPSPKNLRTRLNSMDTLNTEDTGNSAGRSSRFSLTNMQGGTEGSLPVSDILLQKAPSFSTGRGSPKEFDTARGSRVDSPNTVNGGGVAEPSSPVQI
jgi:hypothetical protein